MPCCSLLHSYRFLALCRPEVYQRVLGSIFWVVSRESGAEVLCIFLNDISFLQSFCNCRKWTGFDGSSSPPPKPCFCFEKHIFMTHNQMPCTWQLCDCCGRIWWRKFHLNSHTKDFCKSWVNFLTDQTFCLKKKKNYIGDICLSGKVRMLIMQKKIILVLFFCVCVAAIKSWFYDKRKKQEGNL